MFFANWAPACRVLVENISEWYSLLGEVGLSASLSGLMIRNTVINAERSGPNPESSNTGVPIISRRCCICATSSSKPRLLFLIYRCGIGFAVINASCPNSPQPCTAPFLATGCIPHRLFNSTEVVNAVFVQQTMQVAKGDEEVLLMEKQKAEEKYLKNVGRIFHTLDTSGDGLLSWAEFEVLLEAGGAAARHATHVVCRPLRFCC